MISVLKQRLGIPGLIAVIALVFAMGGAAWAGQKYVITSTGQIKPSVLKQLKGAKGAKGDTGAAGATGAQGPKGDTGAAGKEGTAGTPGTSVTNTALPEGSIKCPEGGAEFKVGAGTPTVACNGEEGSPWTAGGTLPSGETEVGTWGTSYKGTTFIPISLTLPVVPAPEVVYVTGASATGCPGIVSGVPTADAGKLCVYRTNPGSASAEGFPIALKPVTAEELGATPAGTVLLDTCAEAECIRYGMWAVTAS